MIDQTHCPGGDCPLRHDCLRYRWQVYGRTDFFGRAPFDHGTQSCEHHLSLRARAPSEEAIRTSAYHHWLAAGRPEGRAEEFWFAAESSLREQFERDLAPSHERP